MTISRGRMKGLIRVITIIEIICQMVYPVITHAAATIPGFYGPNGTTITPPAANTLPKLNTVVQNATVSNPVGNTHTIQQTDHSAIKDRDSFSIGKSAAAVFDQ